MGFLNWAREKISQGTTRFKEALHEVKEKARDFCDRASARIQMWEKKAKEKFNELKTKAKEKFREIEVRIRYPNYRPTKPDQDAAKRSKTFLDNKFSRGVKETLRNQSSEERLETIKEVVHNASQILDVKVNDVEYYVPPKERRYECGYFDRSDNTLHVNMEMITSDHVELAQEQIYTIFHELMHARQWVAVTGKKDYGYPPETLIEWANNFQNYISPVEGDREYRRQPLERDAFGFEAIIKGKVTVEELLKYNK